MNRNNGSRIFLTELMFSILFFIVIASVCVQCFAQGYVMTNQADELTQAVSLASNAAELFYADDDFESFTDYYDKDFRPVGDKTAVYIVTGVVNEGENNYSLETMLSIRVTRAEDASEIYSLSVEKGKGLID